MMIGVAACGDDSGSDESGTASEGGGEASGEPVKIGVALPLTGAAAAYGEESQCGTELAVEEINAGGGILDGREVKLVYEDDMGTPEGGVTAVQKLINNEGVSAITGGMNSSVVLAEVSVTKDSMLQVNMAAQADAITMDGGEYLFQVNNTVTQNAEAFNSWIVDELQPKSLVYLGENTAFNAGVLETLQADMSAADIEVADSGQYEADTRDFAPILNKLKSAGADTLYIADAFPARTAVILQQVRQIGGFETVLLAPGVVSQGMIDAAGDDMTGVITGEIYIPSLENERNEEFVAAIEEACGRPPGKVELVSYEAIKVIAGAMDEAGGTDDYDAISEAIRSTTFETPRGELGFDDMGRAGAENFYIQKVEDGGLTLETEWAVS
jgi:branched-chain amino acid transport system substrate-binding protein